MAKTFQSLVTESRELLQDTDTDQSRYTDALLLNVLNRGLHDLSKIRPDLTYLDYVDNSLEVPEILETGAGAGQLDWDTVWPWEMWFYNRMVEYVVGVAEITDDEYTVDGRAALFMQSFRNNSIGI